MCAPKAWDLPDPNRGRSQPFRLKQQQKEASCIEAPCGTPKVGVRDIPASGPQLSCPRTVSLRSKIDSLS